MGAQLSTKTSKSYSFPSEKPILVYWDLCGRGDISKCLLYAGNIEYVLDTENANSWPAYKEKCPFGQLPVLLHGESLVLAQGGAINRYCARLGGLYPENSKDASMCDMIIEECMDIFSGLFKVREHNTTFFPSYFGYLNVVYSTPLFNFHNHLS